MLNFEVSESEKMRKLKNIELNRLSVDEFKQVPKQDLVLVLDNIRSMNNVGSMFRTADAFAIKKLCLCGITATPPNREIYKTALGAEDAIDWTYHEHTLDAIQQLKADGYQVWVLEQTTGSVALNTLLPLAADTKSCVGCRE